MLFNSYEFIYGFLPLVLGGFALFALTGQRRLACAWLTLGSLAFYGYWAPRYLVLLVGSAAFNYALGRWICSLAERGGRAAARRALIFAVATDLLVLAYFKYVNFFIDTARSVTALPINGSMRPARAF